VNAEVACWRLIGAVYARPGVQQSCLLLQERVQADIVVLLFGGWLARCGIALSQDAAHEATALVGPWREAVVRPLRAIRVTMKSSPLMGRPEAAALRERIKADELAAERIELGLLVGWAASRWPQTGAPAADLVATNLPLCLPAAPDAAAGAALQQIMDACREAIIEYDSGINTHYLP
jgi:uncharacterized protein (TIGR02444 family)